MTKYLLRIAILCSVLLTSVSHALCSNIACTATVKEFYLRNADAIYISINDDLTPLNCDPLGDRYLTLESTHKNAQQIYAALLSAKATKSNVKFRIVQGSANCAIDYIRVF